MADSSKTKEPEGLWETFCDRSYYDLHCVRRRTEKGFGQGFHMNSGEEARALVKLLNENKVP